MKPARAVEVVLKKEQGIVIVRMFKANPGQGDRFGARKYFEVPSASRKALVHRVAKRRERNSRNYCYVCDCEAYIFQNLAGGCKHIAWSKEAEQVAKGRV